MSVDLYKHLYKGTPMLGQRLRYLCAAAMISAVVGCGSGSGKGSSGSATDAVAKTLVTRLESEWNFDLRRVVFLGPSYFGNSTSFGRNGGALHALVLDSDYPVYRALAAKGLIQLADLNLADVPPGVYTVPGTKVTRAANVTLTDAGSKAGSVDKTANTVTFVLGRYRVEQVTLSTALPTNEGTFHLIEGLYSLEVAPAFTDIWAELGKSRIPDLRFRAVFKRDTTDAAMRKAGLEWSLAVATNGHYAAMDTGPRAGNFESDNVPPLVDQLRRPHP